MLFRSVPMSAGRCDGEGGGRRLHTGSSRGRRVTCFSNIPARNSREEASVTNLQRATRTSPKTTERRSPRKSRRTTTQLARFRPPSTMKLTKRCAPTILMVPTLQRRAEVRHCSGSPGLHHQTALRSRTRSRWGASRNPSEPGKRQKGNSQTRPARSVKSEPVGRRGNGMFAGSRACLHFQQARSCRRSWPY